MPDETGKLDSGTADARASVSRARWAAIEALFRDALEQPIDRRAQFVRDATKDEVAAAETLELLDADARADDEFLAAVDANRAAALLYQHRTLRAGQRIGPFVVEHEIGRGGMAVVYAARDPRLERDVALKVYRAQLDNMDEPRQRLLREARAASAIDHPNIATIYDVGETADGSLWIAMPRYGGETLREIMARGPLPIEQAIRITREVVAGLAAAHARGIIHRDVKPANIIVTSDGAVRIVDFGIAKVIGSPRTQSGFALGTIAYMSPEQTRGEVLDERTDVWAVGAVLYQMITGQRPFEASSEVKVLHRIGHNEPTPLTEDRPDAPAVLQTIVARCLAKDRAERFGSMAELDNALAVTLR